MARTEIKIRQHSPQPVSSQPTFSHTDQDVAGYEPIQIKCQEPAKGPRKGFTALTLLGKTGGMRGFVDRWRREKGAFGQMMQHKQMERWVLCGLRKQTVCSLVSLTSEEGSRREIW